MRCSWAWGIGTSEPHNARFESYKACIYRARSYDCGRCPLKPKCCPKAPERKIPRSIYEDARDTARALADTEAFEQSRHDRKRVEMLFAHLKRILKLGRLRLRGPTWRTRRVHARRHRTEPTTPRQISRPTSTNRRRVCVTVASVSAKRQSRSRLTTRPLPTGSPPARTRSGSSRLLALRQGPRLPP
jgi:hypothetical protein